MSRSERNFYGKRKQTSVVSWCAFKDKRTIMYWEIYWHLENLRWKLFLFLKEVRCSGWDAKTIMKEREAAEPYLNLRWQHLPVFDHKAIIFCSEDLIIGVLHTVMVHVNWIMWILWTTTLAKKIETTARTLHRCVICRACMRLCFACVPVSIFLARVVRELCEL